MISCSDLAAVQLLALLPGFATGFVFGLMFVLWDVGRKARRDLKLLEKLQRVSEDRNKLWICLEKVGLPCAVWFCEGPYGSSPDQDSPDQIRKALKVGKYAVKD